MKDSLISYLHSMILYSSYTFSPYHGLFSIPISVHYILSLIVDIYGIIIDTLLEFIVRSMNISYTISYNDLNLAFINFSIFKDRFDASWKSVQHKMQICKVSHI